MENKIDVYATAVYMDGHGDDAIVIETAATEELSVDAAIKVLKLAFSKKEVAQISRMETYYVPQHYTANELA